MDGVLAPLRAFYGPLALPPRELFAFFVWDIVSARALPARRDTAWQAIRRLPALTPDAMFRTSKEDLEQALGPVGAVGQRIEQLKDGSGHFRRHRELPSRVSGPLRDAVRPWPTCRICRRPPASVPCSSPVDTRWRRWTTAWRAS